MRLFYDVNRTDPRPARRLERTYDFFNRVDSAYFGRVRDTLESWFSRYPAENQAALAQRFRSTNQDGWSSAFWELYLHELFTRLGWPVEVEPDVVDVDGRIDFRVGTGTSTFLVEARCLVDQDAISGSGRRLAKVLDDLDDLDSPDFLLDVQYSAVGPESARTADLRRHLSEWLGSLDWELERSRASTGQPYDPPRTEWRSNGWKLGVAAWAKSPMIRNKPLVRTVGISGSGEMTLSKDAQQLRNALQFKSKKYRGIAEPFVVAVLSSRSGLDDYDIECALFGSTAVQVLRHADGSLSQRPYRKRDGLWMGPNGPYNRTVAAVLAAVSFGPASVAKRYPVAWHNPWSQWPLATDLPFAQKRFDPQTNVLVDVGPDGNRSPDSVLGLPPDWPGDDDPFEAFHELVFS